MTMINPEAAAVIVRGDTAETLGSPDYPAAVRLLADASATGGALSAQQVTLRRGTEAAKRNLSADMAGVSIPLPPARDISKERPEALAASHSPGGGHHGKHPSA